MFLYHILTAELLYLMVFFFIGLFSLYSSQENQLCSFFCKILHHCQTLPHLEAVQGNHTEQPDWRSWKLDKHFILTLCWEAIATSDLGLSGLTAVEGGTLLYQHWTCSTVDRPVHWRGEDRRFREFNPLQSDYLQKCFKFSKHIYRCQILVLKILGQCRYYMSS